MKQLMWAMVALAGAFSGFAARATTDIPMSLTSDSNQRVTAPSWAEITGLPGSLPAHWELIETELSAIWLLKNQDDPNLQGRISAQLIDDDILLKDEVDLMADSFKTQSAKVTRISGTYGPVSTEEIDLSTSEENENVSGIFVFTRYENKVYMVLLTSNSDITRLEKYKNQLMSSIFLPKK
ncbi:hypothetical protein [Budvicia diplopodorum]|uniref:hypothetical protein n=1 Tax=Budvicia diplopodorum TaxID=1119056 RepID=UPI0013586890|nr:hypothetical protein [Budvicia diplopodorum]